MSPEVPLLDPKFAELKRLGLRNGDGSKLFSSLRRHTPQTRQAKAEIRARHKAERNRKRDARRAKR